MLNRIYYFFTNKFLKRSINDINRNTALITIKKLLELEKKKNPKSLITHGYKVFSQQDEDGIIEEILSRVKDSTNTFIEIGLEDGNECNTANLLFQEWDGLWIESNLKHVETIKKNFKSFIGTKLYVVHKKVTPSNINEVIAQNIKFNNVGVLSVDIGVHTFHVLEKISVIHPKVVVVEYNAKYGPKIDWKINYDEELTWDGSDYYGASLKAFEIMMREKGYLLVACNITGVNAFFISKDLMNDKFVENYSSEFHFTEGRYWLKKAFDKNYKVKIK